MAMTPRELYNQMTNGEDVSGRMSAVHAMVAQKIISIQAGELAREKCVKRVVFSPDGANPWLAVVDFTDGELSENAQLTLAKMRQNAHDTTMIAEGDMTRIIFYVYTTEEDAE